MRLEWNRQGWIRVAVRAELLGPLAVHKALAGDSEGWVVSHAATGLACARVTFHRDAIDIAEEMACWPAWKDVSMEKGRGIYPDGLQESVARVVGARGVVAV